jgi:hypothetical protein
MARSNVGQRYDDSLATIQDAKMVFFTGLRIGWTISALPLFM